MSLCEVLGHQCALHFERRRDVVVVGGEVHRQDLELADGLGPGYGKVRVVHRSLNSAIRSGSDARSAAVASAGLPCCRFQCSSASGSSVIRQAMNGRLSPTTMHWLISGCARSRSSSTAGATFLPPAVTMSSFFRPVTRRKPSSSSEPRSPVCSQPSAVQSLGRCRLVVPVAGEDDAAAQQDLAVLGDPGADARKRLPDGADLVTPRLVNRGRGRGLRHAVALEHGDPGTAEEVA